MRRVSKRLWVMIGLGLGLGLGGGVRPALSEVMIQLFNTSWPDMAEKMPELAEAGYNAIWIPPPTKGSGGLSVGYDLWDPFDLGSKDQRGSVRTRYGTEAELLRMIETAHRFGIRIYLDTIMNHRAFDVPGYNENTPTDIYPGMAPEDFHLQVTEDGFYRKWPDMLKVGDWNNVWQVQNLNFSDLIDIAHETPNANFGRNQGDTYPKISFLRHPNNPEYYDFHPTLGYVGFGNVSASVLASNANNFYHEDVGGYLMRSVRYLIDRTKADGLRLDAVKHVPDYFFGAQYGAGKDSSDDGYLGQAQRQFNRTRGYSDTNHRDTVFDTEKPRDDAMMFGEHLGQPPSFSGYHDAGMRLKDAPLRDKLNGMLGDSWGSLSGLDQPGAGGFAPGLGVQFAHSHDSDYAKARELQYAFYMTRAGLPNVYSDGNFQSETLSQSGGAFPRHANTAFLGQFGDARLPNLAYIHNHFARGDQYGVWGDNDYLAYERIDKRENWGMSDADGAVLLFLMNDNYAAGASRSIVNNIRFPKVPFAGDAYLYNYSTYGGGFYVYASQLGSVVVPPGGYFAFSWRSPEESEMWRPIGGKPLTIFQNGVEAPTVSYFRKDGPNGDPDFNPYGVANDVPDDYRYLWTVPRITSPTNVRFMARTDGSAVDVRLRLDGGIDVNSQMGLGETDSSDAVLNREGRPALSTDVYLGYENMAFVQRTVGREKFAAKDSNRNQYGSPGSESYQVVIGTAGVTNFAGAGANDWTNNASVYFAYHDPADGISATNQPAQTQLTPPPQSAAGSNVSIWVKTGNKFDANKVYLYYTVDGLTFPEAAAGQGVGSTRVAEMNWVAEDVGNNQHDWWRAVVPAMTNGTVLRYKIGTFRRQDGSGNAPWDVVFPGGAAEVGRKKNMLGEWEITNFNARTVKYKPHFDYGTTVTGLVEGFHIARARAFLQRDNRAAIYNTFQQTFYYDAATPTGQVVFPVHNEVLGSQEYGVVVRTDPTVREVWFNILDSSPANDDGATTNLFGNGIGTNGQPSWVRASQVTPSLNITNSPFPDEYRFTYRNIPASGTATVQVRLVEISSSTNFSLSDPAGHYTTLQRVVQTQAPTQAMFVAFPEVDGKVINDQEDYVMKIWFSTSLADNIDQDTLKNRFLLRINGSAQSRTGWQVNYYNIDGKYHELAVPLPDLFNGNSNFLHSIEVTHTMSGGVVLQASRVIKAISAATGPYVAISSPPEVDGAGRPYVITLPDVASPTPEQRQFTIEVETDQSASNVWIQFQNEAGSAPRVASTESTVAGLVDVNGGSSQVTARPRVLTGTVSATFSNNLVTGTGTQFSNQLAVGQTLLIDASPVVISQIVSQTSLRLADPFFGTSVTNVAFSQLPRFDVDFSAGARIRLSTNILTVATVVNPTNLTLGATYPGTTLSGTTAYRVDNNPRLVGTRLKWTFLWQNMQEGSYTFYARVDTNGVTNTVEASATRNTIVAFRESVVANDGDDDDDEDGLYDFNENNTTGYPAVVSEQWNNADVHIVQIFGKSDPLSPDTDGDGLPDGLESGWRVALSATATNIDTNGDGFPNFLADLDPPFYNTTDNVGKVPNVNTVSEGGDRTRLVRGTLTNPSNADSDNDGLNDGVEDANRNGWVDGDGEAIPPTWDPWLGRNWPNGVIDVGETWLETAPTLYDSDVDGLADGYGEDKNFNGRIDGDTNSNRVWEAGEVWTESNPLKKDTDGDGLPDGWEAQFSFDTLDQGVIGQTNLRNQVIASLEHGANGNPDNDVIVISGVTNAYVNLLEFQNGTNPRQPDTGVEPPEGAIRIGRGPALGAINGVTNYQEFTDWTWDDLVQLDEYEGDGFNNQGGDTYPSFVFDGSNWKEDGFGTSRDIVAFYARDGGDIGLGGDGKFYFRVDFHDLLPLAEEGYLDLYVVVDSGNPAAGEMALPDDVDLLTSNRWEAVVAVYQSNQGAVYVDTNPNSNSTQQAHGGNLTAFGVQRRDQNTANGFLEAYYNSELDAVEFSISRQALIDAGWNGLNPQQLNYQVYSTKDGTCNSCNGGNPGGGDIGGRNDVRDTIYDDFVAEDYDQSQGNVPNVLSSWFAGVPLPKRAKVATVVHGNQHLQPGSVVQNLINNGFGAGYHRVVEIHDLYDAPVNLHVTPSLASALQWAKADPAAGTPWRDGPTFNSRLRSLAATNVVRLLGTTFSDHMLPYFTPEYNQDNSALAKEFIGSIYGVNLGSDHIFWPPERVLDADVFSKISALNYNATLVDQDTHLFYWLGRTASLGDSAYQINRINGVKAFVLHNAASNYRFQNNDNGLNMPLRGLFSRKARSGTQDQVVTLLSNWEDFGSSANANAYDRNLRWMANRPWIELVDLKDVLTGQVDLNHDGNGDNWYVVDRGNVATNKLSHNYIQHAARGNYDNWFVGLSGAEHGLQTNRFEIRSGVKLGTEYGMLYFGGIVSQAWAQVQQVGDTNLRKLARGALHASTFQTAFHDEDNFNLDRFSIGTYVSPDTTYDNLASFARHAQGQTRQARVFQRVDAWAGFAASVTTPQALAEDVDLDGENEYVLYNDRLYGVFERSGGRLVGAWVRNLLDGRVYQVIGNPVAYAGTENEEEGGYNVDTNANGAVIVAYKTSGLKDWFAVGPGSIEYNNTLYTFTNWTNGWRIVSGNGAITKTVTLQTKANQFKVDYQTAAPVAGQALYVRHGLSPNLYDLLLNGQTTLGGEQHAGGVMTLANTNYRVTVEARIGYADAGNSAAVNTNAVDDDPSKNVSFFTVNMRNQAQTHQVEMVGTNSFSFTLGFRAYPSDWDADGMPNEYEELYGFLNPTNTSDGAADQDNDTINNAAEYIANTDPNNGTDFLRATSSTRTNSSFVVRFPTKTQREYQVYYANGGPSATAWLAGTTNAIPGTGGTVEWLDDGSVTVPVPGAATQRTYQVRVQLPQ